jgi:hypothetical protein
MGKKSTLVLGISPLTQMVKSRELKPRSQLGRRGHSKVILMRKALLMCPLNTEIQAELRGDLRKKEFA